MGANLMKAGCLLIFIGIVGVPVLLITGVAVAANWDAFETILVLGLFVLTAVSGIGLYRDWQKNPEQTFSQWFNRQDQQTQGLVVVVPIVAFCLIALLFVR